jgi:preprotein translocase subunit SecD
MDTAAGVIDQRVNGLGVSESIVQRSGSDRIIVELPGVTNPEQAIETLRGTGQLEFIDTGGEFLQPGTVVRTTGNPNPAALQPTTTPTGTETLTNTAEVPPTGPIYTNITEGKDLDTRSVQPVFGGNQQNLGSQFAVNFAFLGESATRLEQFSSQNIQRPMCIVLDNVVFSCPVIQATLIGGNGQITTSTREEAESIYNQLKYGALPVGLSVESSRTVSATLGQDSVDASLVAGIVGLSVVALFLILYYRLPGLLATIVLVFYTAVIFAIYRLLPVTLTLAGIAGFILSIGVIVDANVLIVGRLKEELRKGKSLRMAVESGFDDAWSAILDSSVAMLITSAILYMFGSSFGVSIIRGFAVTLFLGTLVSLVTARGVTRTFLRVLAQWRAVHNPWLFDLSEAAGLERERRSEAAA